MANLWWDSAEWLFRPQMGSFTCQLQNWLGAGIKWHRMEPLCFSSPRRLAFTRQWGTVPREQAEALKASIKELAQHPCRHVLLVQTRHKASTDLRRKESRLVGVRSCKTTLQKVWLWGRGELHVCTKFSEQWIPKKPYLIQRIFNLQGFH